MGRRLAPVGGAVDEAHELTALRRSVSHVNSASYRMDVCYQCDVRTFSMAVGEPRQLGPIPKGCLLPVRRTYVFETRQLCLNNATRCHRRHGHNSVPTHPSNAANNDIHASVAGHTSPAFVPRMTPRRARSES